MVNTEFKIGDWVTTLNQKDIPNFHNSGKPNSTFQIGYISGKGEQNRNQFVCAEKKDVGNGAFFGSFRHAKNEEIPIEYRTNISELIEIW